MGVGSSGSWFERYWCNRDLYEAAGAADATACSRIGSCGGFEISWVMEKGGPRDPTTQKDAGGTPASQRGHILTDRGRNKLLRFEQMSLILPNLLGPKLVRWLVKILR